MARIRIFSSSNIYIALWVIFNITFSSRIMFSRPLFVILFFWSLYYTVRTFEFKQTIYFKGLNTLFLMFIIYGVYSIFTKQSFEIYIAKKQIDSTIYLISISKSILPIYAFYYLSKTNKISERQIRRWIPILLFCAIIQFFESARMITSRGHNAETLVNNTSYYVISLIPLIFFVQKIKTKWLYLISIYFLCLLSMKRGAILIGSFATIFVILKEFDFSSKKKKVYLLVSSMLLLIALIYGFYYFYESNIFFRHRVDITLQGSSSHRDMIYRDLVNYFLFHETIHQQIFGLGADGTLTISENYAHNDWVEILINNGIIGIFIFFIYWICFFKQALKFPEKSKIRSIIFLLFFIGLFKTLFSMYYTSITTPLAICIGYCISKNNLYHSKK